ncbi:SpaH/EbpB family LPXTG-anchored major pilin [Lacticaseibacillus salsurivasis]|uniref:SpaH/EbpB family LPXTG-anchored major pilin n=1 Tax=Lacticaseibacillus salsurivasis TaxID=3081441 RepID=UPI0030C67857
MKKGKIIRFVGVCGLTLGALGAVSVPVISSHQATVSAVSTVPDETSERSITLHKYTGTVGQNGTTTAPDGTGLTDANKPIGGISFKITKISRVDGKKLDASDASTYTTTATTNTITTAADGTASWDLGSTSAVDGYYLVEEQDSDAVAQKAAPFIVHVPMTVKDANGGNASLKYDINVYPKNQLSTDLNLDPTKSLNGKQAGSVKSGADVTWDLTVQRPADIHGSGVETAGNTSETVTNPDGSTTTKDTTKYTTYASELKMVDVLDDNLMTYKEVGSVVISSENSAGSQTETALTKDDDYTVETSTADGKTTVTVSLTDAGIKKFAAAPKGSTLTAKLTTTVKADSDAKIVNTFDTSYQGTATPGQTTDETTKPGKDNPGTQPTVYFGNVDVTKVDDSGDALANATFTLYKSEADAKAGTNPVTKEDGSVYTVTTDASGKAEFTGLEVDPDSKQETYYLVETDAPVGYDVDGTVHTVTATQDTVEDAKVTDTDNLIPNLPLTGSQGRILLYALTTGLIVVGATGVVVIKRRQRKA